MQPSRPIRPGINVAGTRRLQRFREGVIAWALRLCAFTAVAGLLLIMVFVFKEALPVFFDRETRAEANLHSFFGVPNWQPVSDVPKYGLFPLFIGTLKVVLVAMAFAAPIGVLAALFAAEFASPRMREFLKPAVEALAGVPSVVLGFFGPMVLASRMQA